MGKWALWGLLLYGLVTPAGSAGCGTADNRVDPGDLELRDLLGFSPRAASEWGAEQREAARRVIAGSLAASEEAERFGASLVVAPYRDEAARDVVVAQALARWDERLAREGVAAVPLLRVAVAPGVARATVRPTLRSGRVARASDGAASADFAMELAGWSEEPLAGLAARASTELRDLARDAGHGAEPLVVVPSARLPVLAAYVEPEGGSEGRGASATSAARLLVNPVLLAAREPGDGAAAGELGGGAAGDHGGEGSREGSREGSGEGQTNGGGGAGGIVRDPDGARGGGGAAVGPGGLDSHAIGGNPYSFYGSVAECAYAQRLRCERCLGDSSCQPITDTTDGDAECVRLGEDGGRGYFLQCINLSLAITSVNRCAADGVSSCARSPGAANSLSTLESNANFLEDETCQVGLDRCLAKIYGKPDGDYPTPGGGGGSGSPPRDIDVDCGQSCDDDDNNGNCEASPTCEGPSCNNSLSCDSTCSSSNDQSSGCGSSDSDSDCGSCSDDSGGGQGGSSCSSDDGGSDSGDGCGGGGDSSCDSSCNKSDGSGGSCGSCDSSGDSGGGGSSGGDGCGGGSGGGGCGGGSGGGGCGGGGGDSNKCSVAMPAPRDRGRPPAALSFLLMGLWGLAPIPAVMLARRRVTRKAAADPPAEPLGNASAGSDARAAAGSAGSSTDSAVSSVHEEGAR